MLRIPRYVYDLGFKTHCYQILDATIVVCGQIQKLDHTTNVYCTSSKTLIDI